MYFKLLVLLKEVGSAMLGESDPHPISLKTPASQYRIKRTEYRQNKEKGKDSRRQKGIELFRPINKHWPL